MQKYLPYVFPLAALLIVGFLAFRWYNLRSSERPSGEISPVGEGVEIQNLTPDEQASLLRPTQDMPSADLDPVGDATAVGGQVRYQLSEDRVLFSVSADLPRSQSGEYRVWFKPVTGTAFISNVLLAEMKSGYVGTGAISAANLPLELVVSTANQTSQVMEQAVLQTVLELPEETQE